MDFSLLCILPDICPVLTPELEFVFAHILSDTRYYQILIFANLMGKKWYLILALFRFLQLWSI